jgi:uncharacterized repeat protein (TIGR03803 family)
MPPTKGQTWTKTVLHSFTGRDGATPYTSLIADEQGALHGTTLNGGPANFGTVFKLTPPTKGETWTETVLYSFKNGSDGSFPASGVIAMNGALYGATGGDVTGYGTVFKLTVARTTWQFTLLYSFKGSSDGAYPSGLIADTKGALYGTTQSGGIDCAGIGCGAIFKLLPPSTGQTAWTKSVLYSFTGTSSNDGAFPARSPDRTPPVAQSAAARR